MRTSYNLIKVGPTSEKYNPETYSQLPASSKAAKRFLTALFADLPVLQSLDSTFWLHFHITH